MPDPLDLICQDLPYRCYYSCGYANLTLKDRFGIINRMELYNQDELKLIVTRSAGILGIAIEEDGAIEIAKRSRELKGS